ncbi:hypothetical protein NPA07_05545 [Mycoplasmopsis caviae]|uniref:YobI-like P-loop NTPase domain-containing protein n=1 Tax=Mycoplasmopsis caviae TaxID=55603 RepID=A0A3P8MDL8_9BACT|nr:hypothetical protein [Mycoplasmopsis caviae]UUD35237.1 hypothetical protein NPA07_05545 [Mycoplasmopsis caviae]VDR41980.1 Uncharacterised protein [Mycoplasmopsis caviae]
MSQNNNASSFTNHQCIRNGNIQNEAQNDEHKIETQELYTSEEMKNSNAFKLYKKSLDFAISNNNDKVNNIAIIGSRDGQNKNVIETYKTSRTDLNMANVSLANANKDLLESEIINQITGQVSKKNINVASNKTSAKHIVLWTTLTSIFILLSVVFFSFSARKIINQGWSKTFDLNHIAFFLPIAFILFGMVVGFLAVAIYYGRNYLIDLKKSKNIVIQETKEIAVIEDKENLINLIDKAGLDALIIEDFGENDAFEYIKKIKDINTLVNKRREKRTSKILIKLADKKEQIKKFYESKFYVRKCKAIKFFYVIDNTLASLEDKGNIFDFSLTVLPISREFKKEQINKLLVQANLGTKELSWIKQIEDLKLSKVLMNDFNMYSEIHNFKLSNTMGEDVKAEFKKDYNNNFEEIVKYVNSSLQNNVFSKIKNQNNLALNAFKALKETLGEENKIAQELAYAGCSIHYQEVGFDSYIESQLEILKNNPELEIFLKVKKPNESRYLITYSRKTLKNSRTKLFAFLIYKNLFTKEYSNLLDDKGWLHRLNSVKKRQFNRLFKIVENANNEKVFANIKLNGESIPVKWIGYLLTFNLCSQLNLDMNLTESFYWSREFITNAIVESLSNKECAEVIINKEIFMNFTQDEYQRIETKKSIIDFEKAREEISDEYQSEHLELIEQLYKDSFIGLDFQYYMNDSHQLSSEIEIDGSGEEVGTNENEVDLNIKIQNVKNLDQPKEEVKKVVDLENLADFEEAEIDEEKVSKNDQGIADEIIEEEIKEAAEEVKVEQTKPTPKIETERIIEPKQEVLEQPKPFVNPQPNVQSEQQRFNLNKPQEQQQASRLRQVNNNQYRQPFGPNMYQPNVQQQPNQQPKLNQYQNIPNNGYANPRFNQYPPHQNPYQINNPTNMNQGPHNQFQRPNGPMKR